MVEKYFFIGIKGAGMSGMAQILKKSNMIVEGSDVEKRFFTEDRLEECGIKSKVFNADNVDEFLNKYPDGIFVRGNSFKDDHVEISRVLEIGAKMISYQEVIDHHAKKYNSIAISGTHGKTTTTSIVAHALRKLGQTGYLIGDGTGDATPVDEYFVYEACEYRGHFNYYHPTRAMILNINYDHPDYYDSIEDTIEEFVEFVKKADKKIICCGDSENVHTMMEKAPTKEYITYGLKETNDFHAKNIEKKDNGNKFDVYYKGEFQTSITTNLYGDHNVQNILGAIATLFDLGFEIKDIAKNLETFTGAKRRFQVENLDNGQVMIDDFAHHPNEIRATYEAVVQKYADKDKIAIFQPYTYT